MACKKSNAHPCGEHLACPKSLLLRVFRVFRGSNGSFQVEPSELPRGFGVRWLPVLRSGTAEGGAGNGLTPLWMACGGPKRKRCALTPHPPQAKTLARRHNARADRKGSPRPVRRRHAAPLWGFASPQAGSCEPSRRFQPVKTRANGWIDDDVFDRAVVSDALGRCDPIALISRRDAGVQ